MNVIVNGRATKTLFQFLPMQRTRRGWRDDQYHGPFRFREETTPTIIAHRAAAAGATAHGNILANGQAMNWQKLRHLSATR